VVFDSGPGYFSTLMETPKGFILAGSIVQVCPGQKALPAAGRPTCCSGSRATVRIGIYG